MDDSRKWVRNSVKSLVTIKPSSLFKSIRQINLEFTKQLSKHTFFPGNEAGGSRLNINTQFIIDKDSLAKVCWDTFVMLLTIALSYTIPYSLSFYVDMPLPATEFIVSIYLFDMFITFNTSYYSKGMKVVNRLKIAKHYLQFWFWIDLLASFPFELFIESEWGYDENYPVQTFFLTKQGMRYLLTLRLLRLLRFKELIFNVQEIFAFPLIYNLTSVFTYLFVSTFIMHVITCCCNVFQSNILNTVPPVIDFQVDNRTRYLMLFLKVMETVTSVGYGETQTVSISDKIIQILIMTLTSGLLGYMVGGIQSSIEKLNHIDIYFSTLIRKSKSYLKLKNCPKTLRQKIINYFRNLKKLHTENLLMEKDVLGLLSGPMKEEVFANIQGHYFLQLHAFTIISLGCLKAISYKLKLEFYAPSDIIMNQGETTGDLYFVVGGNVEIFHQSTETVFKLLAKRDYFGEIGFFCKTGRKASVRSFDYSEILKISNHEFFKILKGMPKDYEVIQVMIRNTMKYGVAIMGIKCFLCYMTGHCAVDCHKYVYTKRFNLENVRSTKVQKKNVWGKKVNFLAKFRKQCVKGQEGSSRERFGGYQKLVDAGEMYENWSANVRRKSKVFINLIGSMEEIPEESEYENKSDVENVDELQAMKEEQIRRIYSSTLQGGLRARLGR